MSYFHLPKEKKPEEMEEQSLYVEAVFQFDELESEGQDGEYAIPYYFQHMVVANPGEVPYLRIRLSATWKKAVLLRGLLTVRFVTLLAQSLKKFLRIIV